MSVQMTADKLLALVSAVCPVDPDQCWVTNPAVRSTWHYVPTAAATALQKAAAASAVTNWAPSLEDKIEQSGFQRAVAATILRQSASWVSLTVAQKASAQTIIDNAGQAILALVNS